MTYRKDVLIILARNIRRYHPRLLHVHLHYRRIIRTCYVETVIRLISCSQKSIETFAAEETRDMVGLFMVHEVSGFANTSAISGQRTIHHFTTYKQRQLTEHFQIFLFILSQSINYSILRLNSRKARYVTGSVLAQALG